MKMNNKINGVQTALVTFDALETMVPSSVRAESWSWSCHVIFLFSFADFSFDGIPLLSSTYLNIDLLCLVFLNDGDDK